MSTFKELLNSIWRLHKGFMIKGEFQKPHTWQKDNNLIVIPASELQKEGYSKVYFICQRAKSVYGVKYCV